MHFNQFNSDLAKLEIDSIVTVTVTAVAFVEVSHSNINLEKKINQIQLRFQHVFSMVNIARNIFFSTTSFDIWTHLEVLEVEGRPNI